MTEDSEDFAFCVLVWLTGQLCFSKAPLWYCEGIFVFSPSSLLYNFVLYCQKIDSPVCKVLSRLVQF